MIVAVGGVVVGLPVSVGVLVLKVGEGLHLGEGHLHLRITSKQSCQHGRARWA